MKRLLLGAAAIDRVSRLRGFAADMPAAHPTPRLRPIPRRKWSITGPASISAAISAARSRATTAWRAAAAASWAACRAASITSSHPNWVVGAEAQYSWLASNNNNGVLFPGWHAGDHATTTSLARSRAGSATPGVRRCSTPRAATPGATTTISASPSPAYRQPFTTNGSHKDGYTVGAGLEYMFAPNWSAKAEYQYYNFGSTTFTTGPADIVGTGLPERRAHRQGRHQLSASAGVARSRRATEPVCFALRKGRPHAGLFVDEDWTKRRNSRHCRRPKNEILRWRGTSASRSAIMDFERWWTTNMRAFALGLILSAVALPCACPDRPEIRASRACAL